MAAQTYNTVTVLTDAKVIIPANSDRVNAIISNASGAVILYIGPDASVTTANGIPIAVSTTANLNNFMESYKGNVYGITGSTADVRYWENANS